MSTPKPFTIGVIMLRRIFRDNMTELPRSVLVQLIKNDLDDRDHSDVTREEVFDALFRLYQKHIIVKMENAAENGDSVFRCPRIKKGCVGIDKDGTLVMSAPRPPRVPKARVAHARKTPVPVMPNQKLSDAELLREQERIADSTE
jgi:hypothetical protein